MIQLRPLIADAVRRHGLGGVAVAVVRQGEAPVFECAGLADRDANRAVDTNTVFRIASISKTMTAIGLMQLRDSGLFELDDPVNKYLTTFTIEPPAGGSEVTFRHLLTHTSGIGELPRVSDLVRRTAWGMGKPRTPAADLGAIYRKALRPGIAAGTKWAYANHGFAVVGQLVEDISGRPFAEHMQEHLFEPLGMTSTEYIRTDRTDGRVATAYNWIFGRLRPMKDYDLALLGPGSVLSSLSDMATYAEWLLHGGAGARGDAPVLRPETLAEMMSPQYGVDPRLPGMGLAFWLDRIGEHRVAGHDGDVPGFSSSLFVAPDDGVGVVVLTNTGTIFGAHELGRKVLEALIAEQDPAVASPAEAVIDSPHVWQQLVGYYAPSPDFLTNVRSWQVFGGEVEVAVKKKRLVIKAMSPLRSLRRGLELHALDETEPLLFGIEVEGVVVAVAFGPDRIAIGPPANAVFHRRSALRSSRVRARIIAGGMLAAAAHRRRRRRKHSRPN
jgi:CubicO group peptidase (beta-lactamase class C family)